MTETTVRQGDNLRFIVGASNQDTLGTVCHVTDATIGIRLPASNGRYDPASAPTIIRSNTTLNNPFAFAQVATFDWIVKLDPSLAFGQAQAVIDGTLHLTNQDPDRARDADEVSFDVTNPVLELDKKGSIDSGVAPQDVTYTFKVTNTSTTPVPMDQVVVTDDKCTGANSPKRVANDPDLSNDGLLSNNEVWTFSCVLNHGVAGTYTNVAEACAVSRVDNRPVCSPKDTWTVVLTPPDSPPVNNPPAQNPPAPVPPGETGVAPANVTQAPCTIASPTGLTVRAGELTTIRVRVRNVDAGTQARITLPGGRVLRANTNASGTATFRVRPTKSGRATIRVAECSDVARFTVRQPRQVATRRAPRVTG